MKQTNRRGATIGTGGLAVCAIVGAMALGGTAAQASIITQTDNFGPLSNTLTHLTTGGPYTFVTASPSFNQFNSVLGTLVSASLSWTMTGSENGSGNFAGTGVFSYGGQSQTVTFDTITDPGPKTFDFAGSELLSLAAVIGSGTITPSTFNGTIQQSGYFPWSGSMTDVLGTVVLTYDYEGTTAAVPAPASLLLFASGLGLFGLMRRRQG